MNRCQTDVIIIGSGIAGLLTAIHCAASKHVHIICKGPKKASNTWYAQGGIAAAISPHDSAAAHYQDTLEAGCFYNHKAAVEQLTSKGASTIQDLLSYNITFDRSDNTLLLGKEGAHSHHRILHHNDHTGKSIIAGLLSHIQTLPRITFSEHTTVTTLLHQNGYCVGCIGNNASETTHYSAPHVCIATGGVGQLFKHSSNPAFATGDGLMLAYNAGCRLMDLEFVQFHPTSLVTPSSDRPTFLISEALRGAGAYLVDVNEKRIMKSVHPLAELAPRDVVSREIYHHLQKNNPIFLDARHLPQTHYLQFPSINAVLKEHSLTLKDNLIPIVPVAHYHMGGILTNLNGQTDVPGLYAVGEAACTGVHGANRLASNSLLEGAVFAKNLATFILSSRLRQPLDTPFIPTTTPVSYCPKLKEKIQTIMWSSCGIIRHSHHLKTAIATLTQLQQNNKNKDVPDPFITLALLLCQAAQARPTSLGSHYITETLQQVSDCRHHSKGYITLSKHQGLNINKTFPIVATNEPERHV